MVKSKAICQTHKRKHGHGKLGSAPTTNNEHTAIKKQDSRINNGISTVNNEASAIKIHQSTTEHQQTTFNNQQSTCICLRPRGPCIVGANYGVCSTINKTPSTKQPTTELQQPTMAIQQPTLENQQSSCVNHQRRSNNQQSTIKARMQNSSPEIGRIIFQH